MLDRHIMKELPGVNFLLEWEKNRKIRKNKPNDPYHVLNSRGEKVLTLQKICDIMEIPVPEKFLAVKDKMQEHVTLNWRDRVKGQCVFRIWDMQEDAKAIEDFVQKATNCGAAVIFLDETQYRAGCYDEKDYPVICVPDIVDRCGKFFAYIKNLNNVKTIAVTGTCGKTTTMNFLKRIIPQRYDLFANKGNRNSFYAVSSHIMNELTPDKEVYLQETGAGTPDSIRKAAAMLNVDAFVLLNVFSHHVDRYGSEDNILKDKASYDNYMGKDGVVVTNYDDERIAAYSFKHRVISFGIHTKKSVDFRGIDIVQNDRYLEMKVVYDGKCVPVRVAILGEQNAYNVLAAFALTKWMGFSDEMIVKGLNSYESSGKRQNYMNIGGYKLLVDCYNICEDSLKANIETVRKMPISAGNKKIAIITGENKLGDNSEKITYEMGRSLDLDCFDHVICVGTNKETRYNLDLCGNGRALYEGIRETGFDSVTYVTNTDDLVMTLRKYARPGDMLLFKGIYTLDLQLAIDDVFGTSLGIRDKYYTKKAELLEDKKFQGIRIKHQKGVALIKLKGKLPAHVIIPDEINGEPVTRLGERLCQKRIGLRKVTFGRELVNIGRNAFAGCISLKKITIPGNVKVIDQNAFAECWGLKEVILEEGVIHIAAGAFRNCKRLKKVIIPKSVKSIDERAFEGCPHVEFVQQ